MLENMFCLIHNISLRSYVIRLSEKFIPSANHSVIMAYLCLRLMTVLSYFIIWITLIIIISNSMVLHCWIYIKWNWNWNRLSETVRMSCCRKTDKTKQISSQKQCLIITLSVNAMDPMKGACDIYIPLS